VGLVGFSCILSSVTADKATAVAAASVGAVSGDGISFAVLEVVECLEWCNSCSVCHHASGWYPAYNTSNASLNCAWKLLRGRSFGTFYAFAWWYESCRMVRIPMKE